jgi:hypothetical protein
MNGLEDLMSGSNDRWSEAARRARDLSDNGLGAAWSGG